MKRIYLLTLLIAFITINVNAQSGRMVTPKKPAGEENSEMKTYVMVFLKTGPTRDQSKEKAAEIQTAHLEHLSRLSEEGFLLMAGPFMDDQDIKGILVLNCTEFDQAITRVEEDPAIKAGRLIAEYHLWYTKSGIITLP